MGHQGSWRPRAPAGRDPGVRCNTGSVSSGRRIPTRLGAGRSHPTEAHAAGSAQPRPLKPPTPARRYATDAPLSSGDGVPCREVTCPICGQRVTRPAADGDGNFWCGGGSRALRSRDGPCRRGYLVLHWPTAGIGTMGLVGRWARSRCLGFAFRSAPCTSTLAWSTLGLPRVQPRSPASFGSGDPWGDHLESCTAPRRVELLASEFLRSCSGTMPSKMPRVPSSCAGHGSRT